MNDILSVIEKLDELIRETDERIAEREMATGEVGALSNV